MATKANAQVRPWNRWQDWVALLLGVYLLLATLWTRTSGGAVSAMLVLGVLLVLSAVWSLVMPGSMTSEYAHMVLGVLLFLSPWVLGFAGLAGAAWTCWVVGVLAVAVGAAALPEAGAAHGSAAAAAR
ncbi:SPW repeat protein [Saccharopolyspora sp.]|uniref:SPW repeat domain-containing protein n=1 Tax=Saccharopolyspora sp. TaxID=33915 RepID=UPI0025E4682A|nr:SPW repeat protein [Saccharopolyspora sp.]